MHKEDLNRFFKESAIKDKDLPSAAALAHFQIKLQLTPEIGDEFRSLMNEVVYNSQPQREGKVLAEREEIESADSSQIIRFMRRSVDTINQNILVNRGVALEDEIVPEVIRMLKTSLNDEFIETSARLLSACSRDVAKELIEYFDDVRSPYARSMILVVLGFKAEETHIPWLIEKYREMKQDYPNEAYCDGAYYALYEIESRFYPAI